MENPKAVCDGGDLDCGSGLLLIIKKAMDPLSDGEILEVRSRERSVADDLPAWCRMVESPVSWFRTRGQYDSIFYSKRFQTRRVSR